MVVVVDITVCVPGAINLKFLIGQTDFENDSCLLFGRVFKSMTD